CARDGGTWHDLYFEFW
nr:immunoglobulin heavy chain junction region [Macaca mulatta]MOV45365.1 immunoglobulin heavy chain junction region [Macaca mulatta]